MTNERKSGELTFLTLPVAGLDAAMAFYEATFGWTTARRLATAAFIQLPALTIALMERRAFEEFVGDQAGELTATGMMVSWNVGGVNEVNEVIRRARAGGASVRREPATPDWGGWAGIIETPDGHLWEIVWNPRGTITSPENNL